MSEEIIKDINKSEENSINDDSSESSATPSNTDDDTISGNPNTAPSEQTESSAENTAPSEQTESGAETDLASDSIPESISTPVAIDDVDEEAVRAIQAEWKAKRKIKRLTPVNALLMLGVLGFVPWYIYGARQDIEYFFSSSDPVDLGQVDGFAMGIDDEAPVYPDNRYVRVRGIPIRQVGIGMRDNPISGTVKKHVYQLMGSPVYVEENAEESQYADFMSKMTSTFQPDTIVDPIDIVGRMRRFDTADAKKYVPIRNYYSEKYGTVFCENMSPSERKRKAALLGRGGVSVQIMPDGSVIQADTQTHDTLIDVEPLRGRSATALGKNGTLLHSIDAGLTWRKATVSDEVSPLAIAYDIANDQILFGGARGWTGQVDGKGVFNALPLTQDIRDLAFTGAEPDSGLPALIAVGREGLIEVAYRTAGVWSPATIDNRLSFNGIMRDGDVWFAVGSNDTLMYRNDDLRGAADGWIESVSPARAKWLGIAKIPGYAVAVGTNGNVARLSLSDAHSGNATWTTWAHDDVPGIDYDAELRASAVSDDGKTWVAVGSQGAIVVAHADENGKFGAIHRISGAYDAYGFLDDFQNGTTAEAALAETIARHTNEDFHDVTYAHGMFYAVGENSTLMTSRDGHHWQKRPVHVKGKALRSIAFTPDGTGVIGGEKGTLLVTSDAGKIWRTKTSPTERSIYDIAVSPDYPNGFVFAGAFGLWGFCETTGESKCYLRSRNADFHYRSIEFAKGAQKSSGLRVVAAGDDDHIDKIDDAPRDKVVTSLWNPPSAHIGAIALTDDELPLKPDAPRGQIELVAAGNGGIYRSYDSGYTFKREQTGLRSPIQSIAITPNGSIALAFDGKGQAIYDADARRLWKPIAQNPKRQYLGGTIVKDIANPSAFNAFKAYLFDRSCIYAQNLSALSKQNAIQIPDKNAESNTNIDSNIEQNTANARNADARPVACLSPQDAAKGQIQSIVATPTGIAIAVGSALATHVVALDAADLGSERVIDGGDIEAIATPFIPLTGQSVVAKFPGNLGDYRLISCTVSDTAGRLAIVDDAQRVLIDANGSVTPNVADAICSDGDIIALTYSDADVSQGIYRLNALRGDQTVWSVALGFAPQSARMGRNAAGRWWIAVVAQGATDPSILMSSDGRSWSWRRDMLIDFNAVATAQNTAIAVGDYGSIYVSDNAGKSWTPAQTSSKLTLRDVCISSDASFALAVGDGGTVYRAQNNLQRWTKLKYKLDIDLTSCAIVEQNDRFQTYIAGKGGAIYTTLDPELAKLDLVPSPAVEDIYSMTALETGEVIAVGGVYQNPDTICEEGFLVESDVSPRSIWTTILFALALLVFWAWTLKTFIISVKHRRDFDDE